MNSVFLQLEPYRSVLFAEFADLAVEQFLLAEPDDIAHGFGHIVLDWLAFTELTILQEEPPAGLELFKARRLSTIRMPPRSRKLLTVPLRFLERPSRKSGQAHR